MLECYVQYVRLSVCRADCTCLTLDSHLHADYAGQFHRHATSTFNDRPYYIRARGGNVTSSLRDCDLFLYAFAEVSLSHSIMCTPPVAR